MTKNLKLLLLFLVTMINFTAQSQSFSLEMTVVDSLNNPINEAQIILNNFKETVYTTQTNTNGRVIITNLKGKYQITVQHLNFKYHTENIAIINNISKKIILFNDENQLDEIIITAIENKGLVTSSKIDRKAMAHLQPSSFTDLLELLPGGKAKNPNLTSNNPITIREYGQPNSEYNTSSLGVQFMMDGNPMNSASDMQTSPYENHMINSSSSIPKRNTTTTGIDMRTISTNDIDNVEIIRGIPTASYGDLTSGLVLINRKNGATDWQSRLKVDGFSKLYYLAKGFQIKKNWTINSSADFLNAKADPRNTHENYKRFSGSIRSNSEFIINKNSLKWQSFLDYNISIDDEKVDPDTGYAKIDNYQNKKQNITISNNLDYIISNSFFKRIRLNSFIRKGFEDINQTKLTQLSGPRAISIATEQGVNDGYFPELTYVSYLKTEGRPLDASFKIMAEADFYIGSISNDLEFGADFKYSKNNGNGQIYDVLKPPYPTMSTRPRAFKDIPSHQNLAIFIGDKINYNFTNHSISMYIGTRISKMLDLPQEYALNNKIYIEPRINAQWNTPSIKIGKNLLKTDITFGYGELYKQPTLQMLFPNLRYYDITQLNFNHQNPDLRYVNFMTYVLDVTNYNLVAAKNVKKEIRADFSYAKHKFFITYFDEDMKSGFRSENRYKTFFYKRYDTSGLDIDNLTEKPNINYLPFEENHNISAYATNENGSRTHKKGIEFGYQSPRFKKINTRITLNGAWFKTLYENTNPVHEKPTQSIGGKDYPFVGIYKNDFGYINSGINYNAVFDTYIPNLKMNISVSLQGTIFSHEQRAKRIAEPIAYYDKNGNIFSFTNDDKHDIYKQHLVRNVSVTDNIATKYTFDVVANIKATKSIFKNLNASLFVNRLFSYYQPYYYNNNKIERNFWNEPYFGMELTFNF